MSQYTQALAATLLLMGCGGVVPETTPPVDTYRPQGCREPDPSDPCVFPEWFVDESNWKAFADAVCASTCAQAEQITIGKVTTLGSLQQLGLGKFRRVGALSYFADSPHITDLTGLEGIEEARVVDISSSTLRSLSGLQLRRVVLGPPFFGLGELTVGGGSRLEDVGALNSREAVERITLIRLEALRELPPFDALKSLGTLRLFDAPLLESIDGFNALEEMRSHPTRPASSIRLGPSGLKSITGFQSLKAVAEIIIRNNPALDQCAVERKFASVQTQLRRIEENGPCR